MQMCKLRNNFHTCANIASLASSTSCLVKRPFFAHSTPLVNDFNVFKKLGSLKIYIFCKKKNTGGHGDTIQKEKH